MFRTSPPTARRSLPRSIGSRASERPGFQEGAALTGEETEADGFVADDSEFNIFNTDRRLAAIEQLSDALAPIQQKKSIVYFSSGVTQRGEDNQVQLRAAIDRAVKANVSIYPVDARGLSGVVPGGSASQSSGRGGDVDVLRTRRVTAVRQPVRQPGYARRTRERHRRQSIRRHERLRRRLHEGHCRYVRLLPARYSSTNPGRDGRFRRIRVRLNKPGLRVEHRNGYYANRDFQHSGKADRERQLQDQLMADLSSTDLTRLDVDRLLQAGRRSVLCAGFGGRAGLGDPVREVELTGARDD